MAPLNVQNSLFTHRTLLMSPDLLISIRIYVINITLGLPVLITRKITSRAVFLSGSPVERFYRSDLITALLSNTKCWQDCFSFRLRLQRPPKENTGRLSLLDQIPGTITDIRYGTLFLCVV